MNRKNTVNEDHDRPMEMIFVKPVQESVGKRRGNTKNVSQEREEEGDLTQGEEHEAVSKLQNIKT